MFIPILYVVGTVVVGLSMATWAESRRTLSEAQWESGALGLLLGLAWPVTLAAFGVVGLVALIARLAALLTRQLGIEPGEDD